MVYFQDMSESNLNSLGPPMQPDEIEAAEALTLLDAGTVI
jgi:hypothetical protein